MLVDAYELNFAYMLMLRSQLKMYLGQMLMPVGLCCTKWNGAIFFHESIALTHTKVLHAKKRRRKLNTGLHKPNLQRLMPSWPFWLCRRARLAAMLRNESMGS